MYDFKSHSWGILSSVIILLSLFLFASGVSGEVREEVKKIKIGVLAKRGADICLKKWEPTAEYLSKEIPGFTFSIVPLGFEAICQAVDRKEVDFILANPAYYVWLEHDYGASRIATLKNLGMGNPHTVFGGVIFFRSDREDINTLSDLVGKTFIATDERSFGGWHTEWRELKEEGIDPYRDFADLQFAGTHDAVIFAIRDGKFDAGSVRTDTLERMEMEGKIRLKDFRVIGHQGCDDELPFFHSTRLYPEWPFAKLQHTSMKLAEKVATALINMQPDSPEAKAARCAGWTIPLNYRPVHDCLKKLRMGPYKDYGKVTFQTVLKQYWPLFLSVLILMALITLFAVYVSRLNQRLHIAVKDKRKELAERRRTEELLKESEGKLRTVFENAGGAIFIADTETGIISDCNKLAEKLIGRRRNDIIGMHFLKAHPEDEAEKYKEKFNKYVKRGHYVDFEGEVQHMDGRRIPVLIGAQTVEIGGKNVVAGIVIDITERMKAKERLMEQTKRSELILETAMDGFFIANNEGELLKTNHAIRKLLGYSREEMNGMNIQDFEVIENSAEIKKHMKKVMQKGFDRFETKYRCKNRKILDIDVSTNLMEIEDEGSFFTFLHDITKMKQRKNALKEKREELITKTKSLEEVNTALRVLLKRREEDRTDLEDKVLLNVKELVLPYLEKLKKTSFDANQKAYINIMESNLKDIISPFSQKLSSKYIRLTPTEIQTANLVKDGKTTKEIAEFLNLSTRTVESHRDNIRRKFGIKNKEANLKSYLLSLQ